MTRGERDSRRPLEVVLYGSAWVTPAGACEEDLRGWLSAPVAGVPLFRRLLDPLSGLDTAGIVVVDDGPAAAVLAELIYRTRSFGASVTLLPEDRLEAGEGPVLISPVPGVSVEDLVALMSAGIATHDGRAIAALPMRSAKKEARALTVLLTGGMSPRELLAVEPKASAVEEWAAARGYSAEVLAEATLRLFDTPARLVDVARNAVLDRHTRPAGKLEGRILVGCDAQISPGAMISGAVAVGSGSIVAPGAVLCAGAVVGEDCYVGEGAMISDAVILDGAHVSAGEYVVSAVRGRKAELGAIEAQGGPSPVATTGYDGR